MSVQVDKYLFHLETQSERDRFSKISNAISLLYINNYISAGSMAKARTKLIKEIVKQLKKEGWYE